MRVPQVFTSAFLTLALAGTAAAQYPEMASIFMRADGVSPVTNTVQSLCSDTFSCTPLQLTCQVGDFVDISLLGKINDIFVVQVTSDVQNLQCTTIPIPGLVNSLILPINSSTFTVSAGFMTVADHGRCNGGYVFLGDLFQIPPGIPPGVQRRLPGVLRHRAELRGAGLLLHARRRA